ncbi:MAG: polysaccharide deacetylase family protein [Saprospiraceae bacterium]
MDKIFKFFKREWANLTFQKSIPLSLDQPIISFTFDDAPSSAFVNGGGILEKYGFAGTFYIALTFLDKKDSTVSFSKEELENALANQHELACHTYSHIDLSKTRLSKSKADIKHNQAVLSALFPQLSFKNFSYPFGAKTRGIKVFLSKEFRSARGIGHGLNLNKADLANLKTVKLYKDRYTLEEINQQIEKAIAENAWLIFYTHDVCEQATPYGCIPAYFEAVVKTCAERRLKVLTIDKALNKIEAITGVSLSSFLSIFELLDFSIL